MARLRPRTAHPAGTAHEIEPIEAAIGSLGKNGYDIDQREIFLKAKERIKEAGDTLGQHWKIDQGMWERTDGEIRGGGYQLTGEILHELQGGDIPGN